MKQSNQHSISPTEEQDRLLKLIAKSGTQRGLQKTIAEMFPDASLQERIDLEQDYLRQKQKKKATSALSYLDVKISFFMSVFGVVIMTIFFMLIYYCSFSDSNLGFFEMPEVPWGTWIAGALISSISFVCYKLLMKKYLKKGDDIERNMDKTFFNEAAVMMFAGLAILGVEVWVIIAFILLLNFICGGAMTFNTIAFEIIALLYIGLFILYLLKGDKF